MRRVAIIAPQLRDVGHSTPQAVFAGQHGKPFQFLSAIIAIGQCMIVVRIARAQHHGKHFVGMQFRLMHDAIQPHKKTCRKNKKQYRGISRFEMQPVERDDACRRLVVGL